MQTEGRNEVIKDAINMDETYLQNDQIKIRASSVDSATLNDIIRGDKTSFQQHDGKLRALSSTDGYTSRTQQHRLLNDDLFPSMESCKLGKSLAGENGADGRRVKISMDDEQRDSGSCNDNKLPTYTSETVKTDIHTCDDGCNDLQLSCLSPTGNVGTRHPLIQRYDERKQKRNTILIPASYNVLREEVNNISRSLPSLIESSVINTHVKDITSTPLYKEIYANNIRQYSFLLAKKLGTSNQSPQELRKSYLQNRQKAAARKISPSIQQKQIPPMPPKPFECSHKSRSEEQWKFDSDSLNNTTIFHSEPILTDMKPNISKSRHRGSFTDISSIAYQCDHATITPVPSNTSAILEHSHMCNASTHMDEVVSCTSTDVNCNADTDTDYDADACVHDIKPPLDRRQHEAANRRLARVARMNSFDNMVKNANTFLKDLKTRKKFSKSTDVS